uniref:HNH nuclease domain-containing protein n=1 Tax=uncultured bacterium EIL27G07 TaxID=1768202 RepID=A0A0U2IWP8_9BACT|nr:hypothetical protein [uncultured bacterium EIL27G07]
MPKDCLLLNGNGKPVSYFPLSTLDWKTAIKLIFTRNVVIVKNHEDWVVRSPSVEVEVPSIIMLKRFHKFQNYVKFSRSNVYLRDMYKCQYCLDIFDVNQLTLDHVIPRSKGGQTEWQNIVTCCKSCNTKKGSKTLKPVIEPKKPSFAHLLNGHKLNRSDFPDKSWADYIF